MIAALEAADVPCAPVLRRSDVLNDPQVAANQTVHEIDQPGVGPVRLARAAARFSATPTGAPRPAPALGQDTDTVLTDLGFAVADIARWRADGIIA